MHVKIIKSETNMNSSITRQLSGDWSLVSFSSSVEDSFEEISVDVIESIILPQPPKLPSDGRLNFYNVVLDSNQQNPSSGADDRIVLSPSRSSKKGFGSWCSESRQKEHQNLDGKARAMGSTTEMNAQKFANIKQEFPRDTFEGQKPSLLISPADFLSSQDFELGRSSSGECYSLSPESSSSGCDMPESNDGESQDLEEDEASCLSLSSKPSNGSDRSVSTFHDFDHDSIPGSVVGGSNRHGMGTNSRSGFHFHHYDDGLYCFMRYEDGSDSGDSDSSRLDDSSHSHPDPMYYHPLSEEYKYRV